jgi:Copper binding periplasmic protein CusF
MMLLSMLIAACGTQPGQQKFSPAPAPTPVTFAGPAGYPPPILDHPYHGSGVVMIVNEKEGWIGLKHEEIKDLMPPMEMEFWVKPVSLLKKVKPGDHVDFTIVEMAKGEYITEISKQKPAP